MEINGGGGSSFKKLICGRAKGPIKTILIGTIILDIARFQAIGESLPVVRTESGALGNPRGPVVPKSVVVTKRKANPQMKKRITNFFLEIPMLLIIEHRISRSSYIGFQTVEFVRTRIGESVDTFYVPNLSPFLPLEEITQLLV